METAKELFMNMEGDLREIHSKLAFINAAFEPSSFELEEDSQSGLFEILSDIEIASKRVRANWYECFEAMKKEQ